MLERRTHIERTILSSGNSDRDCAMARGVAMARDAAPGLAILSLHQRTSAADLEQVKACILGLVARLNRANRWSLHLRDLSTVAATALAHHILPACSHCRGLKLVQAKASPTPTHFCTHCRGDGRRPVRSPFKHQVEATLVELEQMDNQAEAVVRKILS